MEKRYQVFVSSTYRDLEDERQEVMHALLELDCIPSGMELFPAANDAQWTLIKKVIDDCDYYVLISAGRYGSVGDEGLSYTEMEYRYALQINKPIIAFLHRDPGKIIAEKTESSEDGRAKLVAFRVLAEKKLCKYWDDAQELGSVVSRSLVQLMKSTPAVGWVRANELADRDATLELLQLRRRVEELQQELSRVRTAAPKGSEYLAQGDDAQLIRFTVHATYSDPLQVFGGTQRETSVEKFKLTWNSIFSVLAPLMIDEANEATLTSALNSLITTENADRLQKKFPDHHLTLLIDKEDFQTIKVQLRALGLIARSQKSRSLKDVATYWTLTPYGDEAMTRLRAIPRRADDKDQGRSSVG
jgi:hypothetical protein